jgi:uncharacterized protein YdcH (DUF465 family)
MKTNLNALLLVLVAEATIQALAEENKKLREHAAGYDRLRAAHGQLKGRIAQLENRIASADEASHRNWTMYQNSLAEVRQLNEQVRVLSQPNDYAALERAHDELREKHLELGRQNIALAAEAERAELAEQQLAGADARIKELEAALVLANLPADSRDNVIQMVREAA